MTICDQDHGGVAVAVAGPLAGGFLEPLDLPFGQRRVSRFKNSVSTLLAKEPSIARRIFVCVYRAASD